MEFPKDFVWGTSISAHQTEGNNIHSDWWYHENQNELKFKSGIATDFYHRYKEDIDLATQAETKALRISVEWARIEPAEGIFDPQEIKHYQDVLNYAKNKGLKTFVTLHHFTNPYWFSQKGGWTNSKAPVLFEKYVKICAQNFSSLTDVFLTINEPQVYTMMSFLTGQWPPFKKNPFYALWVQINLALAHIKAYKIIKRISPEIPVGIVKHIVWYEPKAHSLNLLDHMGATLLNFLNCEAFLYPINKFNDILGVNYYFTKIISNFSFITPHNWNSDLGWWINPQGLENILVRLKKLKKPIYITENGVADKEDKERERFILEMLKSCQKALQKGVDLRGYFHWALTDNFEWHLGKDPRFGLIEISYANNLQRIPRNSYFYFQKICKYNRISIEENVNAQKINNHNS